MSAPEHHPDAKADQLGEADGVDDQLIRFEARQQMVLGAANRPRTRTERGVSWAVWHFGELAATTGPLLAGAVIDGRIAWLSLPIAAVWGAREAYQHHRDKPTPAQRGTATGGTPPADQGKEDQGGE